MFVRKRIITVVLLVSAVGFATAARSESMAASYCEKTKAFAIEPGKGDKEAEAASVAACNAKGSARCCLVVATIDWGCLAIAVAPDGNFGTGTGEKNRAAMSMAMETCLGAAPTCDLKEARCVGESKNR
jgi:hypothetical protein